MDEGGKSGFDLKPPVALRSPLIKHESHDDNLRRKANYYELKNSNERINEAVDPSRANQQFTFKIRTGGHNWQEFNNETNPSSPIKDPIERSRNLEVENMFNSKNSSPHDPFDELYREDSA